MQNILQLNFLMNSSMKSQGAKATSGQGAESGLFSMFLDKSFRAAMAGDGKGPIGSKMVASRSLLNGEKAAGESSKSHKGLESMLESFGLPIGNLRLPESAIPKLAKYLKNAGLSQGKIDQLINSSKDSKGFIKLDSLMMKLKNEGIFKAVFKEGEKIISQESLPRLEEALLKTGLGVEELKNIVAKAGKADGNVSKEKLTSVLEEYFPKSELSKSLTALLDNAGVEYKNNSLNVLDMDPEVKRTLEGLVGTRSEDIQNAVKQNLADILTQKSIPPQEVKSFLENLNVEFAKTTLQQANMNEPGSRGGIMQESAADVFSKIVLRPQSSAVNFQDSSWQQSIMNILKKDNIIKMENPNGNWFKNGTPLKLNIEELARAMGGNEKGAVPEANAAMKAARQQELFAAVSKDMLVGEKAEHKETGFVKEISDGQAVAFRSEKTTTEGIQVVRESNAVNLPNPLPKLIERMTFMVQRGEQSGRIQISPAELGRLDIDLVVKNGHIQANLSAENPMVKEIIDANIGQLKQQLNDQGFVVDKFEVMVGLDDRKYPDGKDGSEGKGKRFASKGGPGEDDESADEHVSRPSIISENEVDVLV